MIGYRERPIGVYLRLGLIICLMICVVHSFAIQLPNSEYQKGTIISRMRLAFASVNGSCSFPPDDVLENSDSFDFLAACDRRMPPLNVAVTEPGVIMCLGLYELGLRLCDMKKEYPHSSLPGLPSNTDTFKTLVTTLNQKKFPNLCEDLKKDLGNLTTLQELNNWSLLSVLQETKLSCSRICIDYLNNPQLMCKLIFWGVTNVLRKPISKPIQSVIPYNDKPTEGFSTEHQTSQSLAGRPETKPIMQNENDGNSEHLIENKDDGESGIQNFNVENEFQNFNSVPSSSELTPSETIKLDIPKLKDNEHVAMSHEAKTSMNVVKGSDIISKHNDQSGAVFSLRPDENSSTKKLENSAGSSTTNTNQANEIPNKQISNHDDAIDDPQDLTFDEKPASSSDKVLAEKNNDEMHNDVSEDMDDDDVNVQVHENLESTDNSNRNIQDFPNTDNFLQDRFEDSEESHFFSYFMAVVVLCIIGYVVFHNKQKILALALEGRSRRAPRRRSAAANYHKLDNNLEEAVTSPCNTSVTHVIY